MHLHAGGCVAVAGGDEGIVHSGSSGCGCDGVSLWFQQMLR